MPAAETYLVSVGCFLFSSLWFGLGNFDETINSEPESERNTRTYLSRVQDFLSFQALVQLLLSISLAVSVRIVLHRLLHAVQAAVQDVPLAHDPAFQLATAIPDAAMAPEMRPEREDNREVGRDVEIRAGLELLRNRPERLFDLATNYDRFGRPIDYEIPGLFPDAFEVSAIQGFQSSPDMRPATALSWNSKGSLLAIGHGVSDRFDDSVLCVWAMRNGRVIANQPTTVVRARAVCVSFHPEEENLIAFGTADGFVTVFSGHSKVSSYPRLHTGSVTNIQWLGNRQSPTLVSSATDGRILFWSVDIQKKELAEISRIMLLSGAGLANLDTGRVSQPMNIQAMVFKSGNSTTFVVGSSEGEIIKYSKLKGLCCVQRPKPTSALLKIAFAKHESAVTTVKEKPFNKNEILTSSLDGTVRLYSLKEKEPELTFNPGVGPVFEVSWSPVRSSVFAVAGGNGELVLYDLSRNRREPAARLKASLVPLRSMKFCTADKRFVATGDDNGIIVIWQLPNRFTEQMQDD